MSSSAWVCSTTLPIAKLLANNLNKTIWRYPSARLPFQPWQLAQWSIVGWRKSLPDSWRSCTLMRNRSTKRWKTTFFPKPCSSHRRKSTRRKKAKGLSFRKIKLTASTFCCSMATRWDSKPLEKKMSGDSVGWAKTIPCCCYLATVKTFCSISSQSPSDTS